MQVPGDRINTFSTFESAISFPGYRHMFVRYKSEKVLLRRSRFYRQPDNTSDRG